MLSDEEKTLIKTYHTDVSLADEQFYTQTFQKLDPESRKKLEALLSINTEAEEDTSPLFSLKSDPGAATLENMLTEIAKLERIRLLEFPENLFMDVSRKRLLWCKQRIFVEDLHEYTDILYIFAIVCLPLFVTNEIGRSWIHLLNC